jgi:alanyl-tRNA synthetase
MVSNAFLRKIERLEPYLQDAMISLVHEVEENASVNRKEFNELRNIVKDLAIAQKETKTSLKELAEAQKKTEEKVEELAEAQIETKTELKELAEAQRKTEQEVRTLVVSVKDVQKQVGGLAMTVGYGLEDKIMPYIYDFAKKEFSVDVNIVDRRNIIYPDGKYDEINIYAEGVKNGKPSFIIGECNAQPGKKDIDKFNQLTDRIKRVITGDIYYLMVGYQYTPDVEAYLLKRYPHIKACKSYEFGLKYKKRKTDFLK